MDHVYRVDKFTVPEGARAELLERILATHRVLKQQPGFLRDYLLEQQAGPDEVHIVTLAEWTSQAALEQARHAVQALHAQLGFKPQELFQRLGIRADLGHYRALPR
jgi:heme-degrading monooxygenase HmoA